MKTTHYSRFRPAFWLCAGTATVLAFGVTTTPVNAAPADKAEKKEEKKKEDKPAKKPNIPKRMGEAIEEKLGKPITDEQKDKVQTALLEQLEAKRAADAKFEEELGKTFGWTPEEVKEVLKPKKKDPAATTPAPAAPAAATP